MALVRPYGNNTVSGFLHEPANNVQGGLVLTHGAGLNCQSPLLIAVAAALCEAGLLVLRCDLRFRQRRKSGPPSPATAADDRDGLREAVEHLQALVPKPIFLGGHSYGARQTSILMTEPAPPPVAALLLLSYPLHPPRRPEQLRTSHFPQLQTPALILHGTRDPIGSTDELRSAFQFLPAGVPVRLVIADKAGHELSSGKAGIAALCAQEFTLFTKSSCEIV